MLFRRLVFLLLFLCCAGTAWAQLETVLMPGELIAGHAKLEANCKECHVRFDKEAQTRLCSGCHKDVGADILNHKGYHGRLEEKECRTCHTEHKGRNAKIAVLDMEKFDHAKTDFPLQGAHQQADKVKCKACHDPHKKYSAAPAACNGCHRKDDKHKGSLGTDCVACHTESDWKQAKFDHSKTTFALTGKHVDVACRKCHADPSRYKGASHECVSCHLKDDKHKGQYGRKCETCHADTSWKTIDFAHDLKTKFKLLGKHESVKCLSCHKGPLYKEKTPVTCIGCHRKDDVHKGALGEKCATCHSEAKWKSTSFNHDRDSKFPLLGKHITTKCDACHKPGIKEALPKTCIGCHKKDDKHKDDFGAKCESCHKEDSWKTIRFDHDRDTKYALNGKHATVKCTACHTGKLYQQKLGADCISCHRKDDAHKESLGERCASCHKENSWKTVRFGHDRDTKYALKGKHATAKCTACHAGKLSQQKLGTDCISCHRKDDVHKDNLGQRCASCHDEKDWKKARIDHARSRFPLTGLHVKVECRKCHQTQLYRDAPSDCFSCHKEDDSKVHKRRLGKKCETCHNARSWKAWDFNHDKRTKFKLDGEHKKPACDACHTKEVADRFDVPRTCGGCHDNDDVHHGDLGPQCDTCHVTSDFRTLLIGSGSQRR